MTPPRRRIRHVFETFWFLPTVLGLLTLVLAEVVLTVDRHVVGDTDLWVLGDLSATGSRSLLTTIGGSMLGVAATSFSITMSVLATTSSTYGPRLVRNFMADRGNQLVLAVFTSSFVYCLVVLRAVRSEGDGLDPFVPTLAVHLAVVIALLDVAVLVYFIHHIAASVQVTSLQQRVGRELDVVVDLVFPAQPGPAGAVPEADGTWSSVDAEESGYVQGVDLGTLVRRTSGSGAVVEVVARPGTHVVSGDVVARVRPGSTLEPSQVLSTIRIGPSRTPHQDVAYAVDQLTEMAVRALSPGTNDPRTAIGAIEAATPGLVAVCSRPTPSGLHRDGDGETRVVMAEPDAAALVGSLIGAVRTWGTSDPTVVLATLALARRLLTAAEGRGELQHAVRREASAVVDRYLEAQPHPVDADRVAQEARTCLG